MIWNFAKPGSRGPCRNKVELVTCIPNYIALLGRPFSFSVIFLILFDLVVKSAATMQSSMIAPGKAFVRGAAVRAHTSVARRSQRMVVQASVSSKLMG